MIPSESSCAHRRAKAANNHNPQYTAITPADSWTDTQIFKGYSPFELELQWFMSWSDQIVEAFKEFIKLIKYRMLLHSMVVITTES